MIRAPIAPSSRYVKCGCSYLATGDIDCTADAPDSPLHTQVQVHEHFSATDAPMFTYNSFNSQSTTAFNLLKSGLPTPWRSSIVVPPPPIYGPSNPHPDPTCIKVDAVPSVVVSGDATSASSSAAPKVTYTFMTRGAYSGISPNATYVVGSAWLYDRDPTTFSTFGNDDDFSKITGKYTGDLSIKVNGSTGSAAVQVQGPYTQIKSSVPFRLSNYDITCKTSTDFPAAWSILGSIDGATWKFVDRKENMKWPVSMSQSASTFDVPVDAQLPYVYFRLVLQASTVPSSEIKLSSLTWHACSA